MCLIGIICCHLRGNTAPYMQYAYTRIRSIFARAGLDMADIGGEL